MLNVEYFTLQFKKTKRNQEIIAKHFPTNQKSR